MAIREQINAILADESLDAQAKRRAIRKLKSEAFASFLGDDLERTFTLANGAAVTISDPAAQLQNGDVVLKLHLLVIRNAKTLFDDDVVIINAPIMAPDGSGGFVENLRGAIRQVLADVVRR